MHSYIYNKQYIKGQNNFYLAELSQGNNLEGENAIANIEQAIKKTQD